MDQVVRLDIHHCEEKVSETTFLHHLHNRTVACSRPCVLPLLPTKQWEVEEEHQDIRCKTLA